MEEYSKAEEAFEDDQTEQCGVSNNGIGVPVLETIIVIYPLFHLYHLLDLALDLIQPLALDPTHPHSKALPPLR